MALLLTALKFILIGVWPKTNLCYLIMMMGCLCISSSSCPAWEMINVPTFLVMASVDTVWPWRTFIVLQCLPILFLPSRLSEGRCQQEPMKVAFQIVWEEKGQTDFRMISRISGEGFSRPGRSLQPSASKMVPHKGEQLPNVWRPFTRVTRWVKQ